MCSLEDLQEQIAGLDRKLDSYHDDSERQFGEFGRRLTIIEATYLTRDDLNTAIHSAIEAPMNQIIASIEALTAAVQGNRALLDIHERKLSPRRQLWYGVTAVWRNRRPISKLLILVGGVAAAFVQIVALLDLLAMWFG